MSKSSAEKVLSELYAEMQARNESLMQIANNYSRHGDYIASGKIDYQRDGLSQAMQMVLLARTRLRQSAIGGGE